MSDAIQFRGVKKTYRTRRAEIPALKGIDFAVKSGEIFGFAGPNGAGKSTAIKILVGLLLPDDGECTIFSQPCGTRDAKRMLGYLPEVTLYHEFMSAQELLRVHAGLAGFRGKERDERCHKALERVGLSERKKSRLSEFSKGMKQRFGIAQAIVGEPKLLVLDELTSGLDPQAQASLLELLEELRSQGLTIFFSSHHLAEIEKICDSVAIVHKGEIKAVGSMNEVLGKEKKLRVEVQVHEEPADLDEKLWSKGQSGSLVAYLNEEAAGRAIRDLEDNLKSVISAHSQRQSLEDLFLELTESKTRAANTL